MNEMNIITIITTLVAYVSSEKFIFPKLLELWNWIKKYKQEQDEKNINATNEILSIKKDTIEVTERQFEVLLNQISRLETELKSYADELQKLRNTILKLNAKLYEKTLVITTLQNKCCNRENCKDRIACENYLCTLNVEEDED